MLFGNLERDDRRSRMKSGGEEERVLCSMNGVKRFGMRIGKWDK
jgi:hypothetical protein